MDPSHAKAVLRRAKEQVSQFMALPPGGAVKVLLDENLPNDLRRFPRTLVRVRTP